MLKTELSDSCLISLYTKGNEEAMSTIIDIYNHLFDC